MDKSVGSGTIIDEGGTILTCAHVVIDFQGLRSSSKGKVEVTLQDGRSFEGTVVNVDLHSDIAIVKIKSKTPLPAAKLESSSKLRLGDWVLAMGCPLTLQNTVTAGIVSCVDRKSSDLGLGGMHREYLQTDCAINQVMFSFEELFALLISNPFFCFVHLFSVSAMCFHGSSWSLDLSYILMKFAAKRIINMIFFLFYSPL